MRMKKKYNTADWIILVFMVLCSALCIIPMWYIVAGSLNDGTDYLKGGVYFWPRSFTVANYLVVLKDSRIWKSLLVTLLRVATGPILHVLLCSLVAYGMSRKELHGKKFFNIVNLFTMFFGGGLVPFYVLCKLLGLLNTFWMYIIPGAYSVYNMILIRSFFKSSPEELHEAAVMDGAGEYYIFGRIMLPLAKPILATIFLWGVIGHWNDYLTSMFYVPLRPELYTLSYVIQQIIQESSVPMVNLPASVLERVSGETITLAAMVFSSIPILALYPFLQKYFTKGIYVGSLKG